MVGDAVRALSALNVRECSGGVITGGTECPVLATQPVGRPGVIVSGPLQVISDGRGYTWYRVQWPDLLGWSVENYLERLTRPAVQATLSAQGVILSWEASRDSTSRVQFKERSADSAWRDLSPDLRPSPGSAPGSTSRLGSSGSIAS